MDFLPKKWPLKDCKSIYVYVCIYEKYIIKYKYNIHSYGTEKYTSIIIYLRILNILYDDINYKSMYVCTNIYVLIDNK
jgi:hypothetical protein